MTYEEVISELRALEAHDFNQRSVVDGPKRLRQITNALMDLPQPERAIPELFAVMERLADSDLGAPGPLVHTLERMEYESELVASIRRQPTPLAIWMVNRLLNSDLPADRHQFYIDLLALAAEHPGASESVRDEALEFIEFQRTRSA